ncbi:hypothetical protein Tco_0767552 [Tanacetum coccineum]
MMKGLDIGIQEKKAKLFNEWERFTSTDEESIESYYHRFSKLMNDFKRNKHFLENIANNLKFLNNQQPEWRRHVTFVHQTKYLHEVDYTQLYDFLKYNLMEVNELRAERLARAHDPLALMENYNNPYNYPVFHQDQPSPVTYMQQPQPNNNFNPQPSFNMSYMQQPMPNPEDITYPITAMNMALVLMAKAFKLNYSTPTNNNKPSKFLQNHRNDGNQFRQYAGQNVGNQNGYNAVQTVRNEVVQNAVQNLGIQNARNQNGLIVVSGIANQNLKPNRNGNVVAAHAEGNAIRNNEKLNPTLKMKSLSDGWLQEILKKNERTSSPAHCILMANLQHASTLGTQTDKAPVYDSDGSTEVHKYENCYNNEISSMFTQEEQYTELLEPILELHQVQQNDSNVIFTVSNVE